MVDLNILTDYIWDLELLQYEQRNGIYGMDPEILTPQFRRVDPLQFQVVLRVNVVLC